MDKVMPLPIEAMQNCRDDVTRTLAQLVENTNKAGDSFLYVQVPGSTGKPPRYIKSMGLTQFSRVLTTIQQLLIEKGQNDTQLKQVAEAVTNLQQQAQELSAEGARLSRWDFLEMALFGREKTIERIKARRIKEQRPYVDLDGLAG